MPHQVNELYKKLKEVARTPDRKSPVVCGIAIHANAPREYKENVLAWLEQIVKDIKDDIDTAMMFSVEGVHLEDQDVGFKICFLDIEMPDIPPLTDAEINEGDPTLN